MNLIIPMAGMGTRLRPQTLLTPKPLLKISGKTIVERIIEEIIDSTNVEIKKVHFVIGRFGEKWVKYLENIVKKKKIEFEFSYQDEALGTAHAVYCAKESLKGPVLITFADTLFKGSFKIENEEGIIWTYEVKNPEAYGVVTTSENEIIEQFIEKPKDKISDKAIIGIYYFKEGNILRKSIKELIEKEKKENNEYQLTNSLEDIKNNGLKFKCKVVEEWMDCGNKEEMLKTMMNVIKNEKGEENEFINNPVYIGNNVKIINSKIGPNVSIEDNTIIEDSKIQNSIVYNDCNIRNCEINNSMIGEKSIIEGIKGNINIGPYNKLKNE